MTLVRIPTEQIVRNWAMIEPFLVSGLEWSGGDFNVEHAKVYLTTGQWVLIGVFGEKMEGALTVSFTNYPNERVAFITAIGGKHITSRHTYDQLRDILKTFGATKIQGSVRQSVARLWRRLGFQERSIIVENRL